MNVNNASTGAHLKVPSGSKSQKHYISSSHMNLKFLMAAAYQIQLFIYFSVRTTANNLFFNTNHHKQQNKHVNDLQVISYCHHLRIMNFSWWKKSLTIEQFQSTITSLTCYNHKDEPLYH